MSQNQNTAPGMSIPTKQGMLGNTPSASAHQQNMNTAAKAQGLKSAVGGGKYRRKHKYGGGIEAPQYSNPGYTPQNGPGQDPNSQITKMSGTGPQQNANAVYDKQAMKGGKYGKKGGQGWSYKNNPDWNWNCMSGGKRRNKSRSRRSKSRKSYTKYKRRPTRKRSRRRKT